MQMKRSFSISIGFFVFVTLCVLAPSAQAQFSKPVIVMKGYVFTADQKPATVRLSIHETGESDNDTSSDVTTCGIQEITAGRANSESGHYLLILKPATKYWVHIEGTFVQSIDTLIQTPKIDKPLTIEKNFAVNWRQNPDGTSASDPVKKD